MKAYMIRLLQWLSKPAVELVIVLAVALIVLLPAWARQPPEWRTLAGVAALAATVAALVYVSVRLRR
jgi:hypothetical protein